MARSFRRTLAPLFLIAAFPGFLCAWADTVLYSTSFEAPAFTTGPIAGQNGWNTFGPGIPTVENNFAYSGSQAVFINGGTASQSGPYYASTTSGPLVDLSAEIAIFSSTAQTGWQFAGLGPGLNQFLGGIDILPDDSIEAITAGLPVIGNFSRATAFNGSAWQNVNLLFDLTTQTYTISLNGTTLASGIPFCGDNGTCTSGAPITSYGDGFFDGFGTGNDSAYMDNYSATLISSTPEPSSIALLGTGLLAVSGTLRRRWVAHS